MARNPQPTSLGGLPISIDLGSRDYESLRTDLIELVKRLTTEWTDFSDADPGVAILEATSYIGDVLNYYIDRMRNEGYLLTAQERAHVEMILAVINYRLSPGSAASVNMTVTTVDPGVVIPALTKVTSTPTLNTPTQIFEFLSAVTIPLPGTFTIDDFPGLVAVHGETVIVFLGVSDGTPNQEFIIDSKPLALNPDGSSPLQVLVDAVLWSPSGIDGDGKSFVGNEPGDLVYRWSVLADGRTKIRFGDGVNGSIPVNLANLTSNLRIGGGSIGNQVGVNTLKTLSPPIAGVSLITNQTQPSGGAEPEDLTSAKMLAPLTVRSGDRAVTLEDFETEARRIPGGGVKAAHAVHRRGAYDVVVYIMADGSNPIPSGKWFPRLDSGTGLIGAVGRWLTQRKVAPTILDIQPVSVVPPRLEMDVVVESNVLRSQAGAAVERVLALFFLDLIETFGDDVPLSRIYQLAENARGVDFANILKFQRSPILRFDQGKESSFISAATLMDLNSVTPVTPLDGSAQDTYTLRWLNGIVFNLKGESSGFVKNSDGSVQEFLAYDVPASPVVNRAIRFPFTTVPTVPDQIQQFDIQILVDAADRPMRGDRWIFGIDKKVGDITVEDYEVLLATVNPGFRLDPSQVVIRLSGGIG